MSVLTYVESNTESVTFKGMFNARGLQSPKNTVIFAKAGISTEGMNLVFLAPRLRGNDGVSGTLQFY